MMIIQFCITILKILLCNQYIGRITKVLVFNCKTKLNNHHTLIILFDLDNNEISKSNLLEPA